MHRCGSPEEARGVDANAAASGATIRKANKLCGMFLPQGTCSIILAQVVNGAAAAGIDKGFGAIGCRSSWFAIQAATSECREVSETTS